MWWGWTFPRALLRWPEILQTEPATSHGSSRPTSTTPRGPTRSSQCSTSRSRPPAHGPGDATLGIADLEVVGQVAGEAHAGLGHEVPLPGAWPGGLPVLVEPRTGGCRGMPSGHQGEAVEPTKSAIDEAAEQARLRCRVGWWGACGWGSGMPVPSGQIPPPWAWWENEAPTTRAACRPASGRLFSLFENP